MALNEITLVIFEETDPAKFISLYTTVCRQNDSHELGCVVLTSSAWKVELRKVEYVGQS